VYRAVDQYGQVTDVLVSARRDANAVRRFLHRALTRLKVRPSEVITDAAPVEGAGPAADRCGKPAWLTRGQLLTRRRHGVYVSAVWGGTLKDNEVGPGIYVDYLPTALATKAYRAAPEADVVGEGLDQIPAALDRIRRDVSAKKLVVRL